MSAATLAAPLPRVSIYNERMAWIGYRYQGRKSYVDYIRDVLTRVTRTLFMDGVDVYNIAKRLAYKHSGNPTYTLSSFGYLLDSGVGHFHKGMFNNRIAKYIHPEIVGIYSELSTSLTLNKSGEQVCQINGSDNYCYTDAALDSLYHAYPDAIENISWCIACQICLKRGGGKGVHYRSDIDGWDKPRRTDGSKMTNVIAEFKNVLCTSCWNRARAVKRRLDIADELRRMTNKLKGTLNVKNNHNKRLA